MLASNKLLREQMLGRSCVEVRACDVWQSTSAALTRLGGIVTKQARLDCNHLHSACLRLLRRVAPSPHMGQVSGGARHIARLHRTDVV